MFTALKKFLIQLPRASKQGIVLAVDFVILVLASWAALALRFESWVVPPLAWWWMVGVGALISIPLFFFFGLYRTVFRYAGLQVLHQISVALLTYTVFYIVVFTVLTVGGVPRSTGLIQPLIFAAGVVYVRMWARHWLGSIDRSKSAKRIPRVVIYGAGSAGRQLATGFSVSADVNVVGFVDDNPRLQGQILNGIPIVAPADLPTLVDKKSVDQIILALPSAGRSRRLEVVESLRPLQVAVKTLPGLSDLALGDVTINDLRELDVDDLLGRSTIEPDPVLMQTCILNRVVLVTGAGGSIGSELCRQILAVKPSKLVLLEVSEFHLYQIEQSLMPSASLQGVELVACLGSVRDERCMRRVFDMYRPQTVYHAAAYKHVPLVEHNMEEGLLNNVWGTYNVAQLAMNAGVCHFVLVSTDKAVRPTNVMGASKRVAELCVQALADQAKQNGTATVFSMVRFGNVLGSSGSVVPLFRHQIEQGGPITLTDDRVTRYFMSIPEAAQLVIQAGAMAQGGEVFVLDMGQSVRIYDLAKRMIELSGLELKDAQHPMGDIEIKVVGLRPGEKLFEELLIGENPMETSHPKIMKAQESYLSQSELDLELQSLYETVHASDELATKKLLSLLVAGYQPKLASEALNSPHD
jgi:FlaA1/EpsC-like NDP-sugar epimerase